MNNAIGIFDSGFGGLTVMREVMRLLPHENIIYLGDTAHLPYGNKSPETILQLATSNATFLLEKNIKLLLVACHTASAHALETLQKTLPIPVVGTVQAGLDLIQNISRIAILGTTSTIGSGIYQTRIAKQNPNAKIYPIACPLFVPIVEEGFHHHSSTLAIAKTYLKPIIGQVDAVLLACTHYPLLRPIFQKVLGPQVQLLEPAEMCALQTKEILSSKHLLNSQKKSPSHQFYASDDPEKFRKLGEIFLQISIQKVDKKMAQ